MDHVLCTYSRGRLFCFLSERNYVNCTAFRFQQTQGFTIDSYDCEVGIKARPETLNVRKVHAAQECVDQSTGDRVLFLLVRCSCQPTSKSNEAEQHCLLRVKRQDGAIYSHTASASSSIAPEIVSFFDLTDGDDGFDQRLNSVTLTYGPVVLSVTGACATLFHQGCADRLKECAIADDSPSKMKRSVFTLNRMDQKIISTPADGKLSSMILATESDENWILAIIFQQLASVDISKDALTHTIVVLVLEKQDNSEEYTRRLLDSADFVPQDYASKVSTVNLTNCRRHLESDSDEKNYLYDNCCIAGLNDGYVLIFVNGCMKTCVSLECSLGAFPLPVPPAVDEVHLLQQLNVLVCHASSMDCFVVNIQTTKVVQHWQKVEKFIVGDFLQRGGLQLLLLFEGWSPQQPDARYLITDLQGLFVDRQSSGMVDPKSKDGALFENLQQAFSALQAQNQAIVRGVSEEEQRLETKLAFMADTWLQLQGHNLNQRFSLKHPEIPLTPLLGSHGDEAVQGAAALIGRPAAAHQLDDIRVVSTWHRIVGGICVLGVKVINTSERKLSGLTLVMSSFSPASPVQLVSGASKIWCCSCLPVSAASIRDANSTTTTTTPQAKRQRVDHRLLVQQIDVFEPAETVTVTCSFPTPPLSFCSQMECFVHVQLPSRSSTQNQQTSDKSSSVLSVSKGFSTTDMKVSERTDFPLPIPRVNRRTPGTGGQKFVFGGKVILNMAELLQGDSSALLSDLADEGGSSGPLIEEAALALSAMQESWSLCISFVLHEAAILSDCFHKAGLAYHSHLGQYIYSETLPQCLRLARILLESTSCCLSREARLLVFARDTSQLLLLLRHLYQYLPDDATIALTDEQSVDTNIRNITAAMATELTALRLQSRAMLQAHKDSHQQHKGAHETCMSGSGDLATEADDFAVRRERYLQIHEELVTETDREHFFTSMRQCAIDTDTAAAKL